MSPSPENPKRRLRIDAIFPTVEIFVIDGANNVVARGVQTLSAELPLGIYKIRYQVGARVVDTMDELPPGQGDHWALVPELTVTTPVPLLPTSTGGQPTSAETAMAWSKEVHVSHGRGSRIFVFVNARTTTPASNGVSDLTIRTFGGEKITPLSQSKDGCLGCTIELDPGNYLLRVAGPGSSSIEQSIYAADGWQTQVFVPVAQSDDQAIPDLSESAVLMAPIELGFQPDLQTLRWIEAARQSLASGRGAAAPVKALKLGVEQAAGIQKLAVDESTLREILRAKFLNPMLGIYGAHLMALKPKPNLDLLREVVGNLQKLVGEHPDVTSLLLYLKDERAAQLTYPQPPMLRSSWSLIVRNSTKLGIVPARSYSAQIAGNLWGSGACLAWTAPVAETLASAAQSDPVDWKALAKFASNAVNPPSIPEMTPVERTLYTYLAQTGAGVSLAKSIASDIDRTRTFGAVWPLIRRFVVRSGLEKATRETAVESISPDWITNATGIPYPAINEAAASLSQKLGISSGSLVSSSIKTSKS